MPATAALKDNWLRHRPAILIAIIGALIALIAPFDVVFMALTAPSPLFRPVVLAAMVFIGAAAARRSGLRLEGHGAGYPAVIGLVAGVAIAVYVVILDAWLFRSQLPENYVMFAHEPLLARLSYYMLRAFNENILYRLFVFSGLVWLIKILRRNELPSGGTVIVLMIVAQVINVTVNLAATTGLPTTPLLISYDVLRYIVPGVIWAGLFWRFGFATAEVASVGCHLFLQPALGALL